MVVIEDENGASEKPQIGNKPSGKQVVNRYPEGVTFSDTTLANEIGGIEITAPELLKGKTLSSVMSLANMDELGEIIENYADSREKLARIDELNNLVVDKPTTGSSPAVPLLTLLQRIKQLKENKTNVDM